MRTIAASLTALFVASVTACGGEQAGPGNNLPPPPAAWTNKVPKLLVASPGSLAVGEDLTILGQNFIEAKRGLQMIRFKGSFFDDKGKANPIDLRVKGRFINSTKILWKLWPNIVFSPTGDRLGYFLGQITVTNIAKTGDQKTSQPLPVKVTIKPSLIPRVARPVNSGCQSVVSASLEKTGFAFTLEAVGLREGSKNAPLVFTWAFQTQQWAIASNYGSFDPDSVLPKTGIFTLEDKVESGRVSVIQDGGTKSFLLKVGSDLIGSQSLKTLATKAVPTAGNNYTAFVNVAAVDGSGKTAKVIIPIQISRGADMVYSGISKVAERFPPVMVSDCIPGGDIGRHVTYREDKSESRTRGMSFQYNANVGVNLGLPSNPFALGVNFSAGFGVDVNASISTSKSKSLDINGQILPGIYGVFYRQTTKVVREARLIGRNKCGREVDLGKVQLTDWLFTPELATGPKCRPSSQLPKAQKFL